MGSRKTKSRRFTAEAYKMSKEFFGDDLTASWEPDEVRAKFPELAESLGSHKILSRSAILQGLWKFAGERTRAASNLIDQLQTAPATFAVCSPSGSNKFRTN